MRALLIVNPHATSTNERRRDLLAHALAGEMKLQVAHTKSRGHAMRLAAAAADSGVDVVVVHGGDGTVNEVVNGLMYRGVRLDAPLLAVVPGGSTNVFARAVGIDPDPTVATEQILEALAEQPVVDGVPGSRRRPVLHLQCRPRAGRRGGARRRKAAAGGERDLQRDACQGDDLPLLPLRPPHPRLTLELPGRDPITGVHMVFVSNVDPWTYFGNHPIRTNPGNVHLGRTRGFRRDEHERAQRPAGGRRDPQRSAGELEKNHPRP